MREAQVPRNVLLLPLDFHVENAARGGGTLGSYERILQAACALCHLRRCGCVIQVAPCELGLTARVTLRRAEAARDKLRTFAEVMCSTVIANSLPVHHRDLKFRELRGSLCVVSSASCQRREALGNMFWRERPAGRAEASPSDRHHAPAL